MVEKAGDAKAKVNLQPPSYIWRSIPDAQKITVRSPKKTKRIPSRSTIMGLSKKRLSPIPLLPLINLRPRTAENVMEANKKIV